jgi:hypothetical protein
MNKLIKNTTLFLAALSMGCTVEQATQVNAQKPDSEKMVVIRVQPGHKLTEINRDHQSTKIWLQTRPAQPDEYPGIMTESIYDYSTGQLVKQIMIVEQAGDTTKPPAAEPPAETEAPKKLMSNTSLVSHCEDLTSRFD